MKRAEREPPERDRAERAVSIPGRAAAAVAVVMLVAAIGIGGQALSQNEGVSSPPASPPPASPSIASSSPAFIPATVPDVLGRTVATAEQRILGANLEVGETVFIAGKPGRVVRTDPTPGEAVRAGTPVTIYVGETGG